VISSNSNSYHLAGESVGSPTVLSASGGETLIVPGVDALLRAEFSRVGFDLLLTMTDGTQFLIVEYFSQVNPATLMTEGGSALPPDLVSALAGPMAPGQYADIETAVEQQAIGLVDHTLGEVTATRVDGTTVTLNKDSAIYQGDILETGKDGAVSIVFIDETEFSLGTDGRMVLDELIFDPSSLEGSSTFTVIQGVFVFVSGEIAANNPEEMVVRTPVATLGIRGTKVAGRAAAEGDLNVVTLMPENDGVIGSITVSNSSGTVTLSNAFETTTIKSIFNSPTQTSYINENQADSLFGGVNKILATNIAARNVEAQRSENNDQEQDDGARQDQDSSSAEENSEQPGSAEESETLEGEQETPLGEDEGEEAAEDNDGEDQELEDAQLGDETGLVQGAVVAKNVGPGEPSGDITRAGALENENLIEAALVSENVAFNEFEAALESGADFGEAIALAITAQETLLGSIIEGGTEAYFDSIAISPQYGVGAEDDQDFNLQDIEAFRDQETLANFAASLTEMGFSSDLNYDQEQDWDQEQGIESFDESSFGEDGQPVQEDGLYGTPGEFSFEGPGTSFGDSLLTAFISNPVDFNPLEIIQFGEFQIFDPLFDPLEAVEDILFDILGINQGIEESEDFEDRDAELTDVLDQEDIANATSFLGTTGADSITGTSGIDVVNALAGDDTIFGLGGNDIITGGSGNDIIDGGSGNDKLFGGSGNDLLDGGTGNDELEGGSGDDILVGGNGDDEIEGLDGNDNLDGGSGNDELNGGAGNDSISGGDGIDLIAGDEGNDILLGGAGNDVIVGDAGDDTITGGSGIDVIAGGDDGSDIFRFVDPADGSLVSSNVTKGDIAGDTTGDFNPGEDKFQFISSEFGNLATGTLSSSSFTSLQASNAQYDGTNSGKSGAIFIYDNTNTLYFDPDTSAAGYTVIAQTQSGISVANTDIDIASS
jgi:Ca2+-binding RTX toxin-like protein